MAPVVALVGTAAVLGVAPAPGTPERAQFLRRFFRDLSLKAGFKMAPDPRNLGQKHVHAMVQVWHDERLAPATIQTYLSFLRGLAMWMGKPGFVRGPAHYGLSLEEYQRHESAQRDKSWSGNGIDVEALLAQVSAYDARIGASMRLMVKAIIRHENGQQPYDDATIDDAMKKAGVRVP